MNTLTGATCWPDGCSRRSTHTRALAIAGLGTGAVGDTVGFIRDLPHNLIASFGNAQKHQADLLLHVADASNPAVFHQIASVYRVLEELHIEAGHALVSTRSMLPKAGTTSTGSAIRTPCQSVPHRCGLP
jgi:GTP-binding protein HflX